MADSKDITLKIDDRDVTVPPGTLVIEAARRMGIEVPSFCYFPGLSLQAACRMCLVEVEKAPKLQTACTLVAMPGVRQGRRVRIAGHGFHLRRGQEPLSGRKAPPARAEVVRSGVLRCAALHP